MSFLLDNRTQTVVQVAVSVILCLVMLIAWRTQKTYPGFERWTISKLPHALGFLLISWRGAIPDVISILLANILLFISPILLYEGIRLFLGKPYRNYFHYALMALLIAGFSYFLFITPSVNARILILAGFTASIIMQCAIQLFTRVPPALRTSYWFTASMFGLYSLLLILRVVTARSLPQLHDPFASDLIQSLVFLGTIVMPIGWTFGFFLMTNARLSLELRTAEAELREMATTDFLTGVLNRRAFIEMGLRVIARARRDGAPLTILMLDLDHFKRINDRYGHAVGDTLLRAITETCRTQLRPVDLFARWGGEEFVILLPDIDITGGLRIAERLRQAVEALTLPAQTGDTGTTISIGCADWSPDETEIDAVLHCADVALYHAKARGRNCVIAYQAELDTATLV